jgi:glucosyl-3-phosphoglycerate synthase
MATLPPTLDHARAWYGRRTYHHRDFPLERLLAERSATVSMCLPAREEVATIGAILEILLDLKERGLVDQVVVIDAASEDGTADVAARAGAEVHQESGLMTDFGPAIGKGDAMWRALSVLTGEVVCYLDADSEMFGPHFPCGMLGPIFCEPGVELVKGFYRRPFRVDGISLPDGGGRVTELTARPLLNLFYPDLAGVRQPLAGELTARRSLLERLPFATGYAIETAHLIDAYRLVGLDAIAQVDLEVRQNRHQPLDRLSNMAFAVLCAVAERLKREGRLDTAGAHELLLPALEGRLEQHRLELVERPPMATLRAIA